MSKFTILPVLLAALWIAGCAETDEEISTVTIETVPANSLRIAPENMPAASISNILQSHLNYSFSEFQTSIPTEVNSVIAPFDWQQMLAALALGAEGTTLDVFVTASKFDFKLASTFENVSVWEQAIASNSSIERNSYFWGQSDYLFSIDYLKQQAELFGPSITPLNFRFDSNQSQLDINAVLMENTYFVDSSTRVVATQTTSIVSSWSSSLQLEAVSARFGGSVEQQWVDMVKLDGLLNVYQGENYKAVQVPLNDSALSLIIITPDEDSFGSVRTNLKTTFWNQLLENLSPTESTVYIPKFIIERELIVQGEDIPLLGVAGSDTEASFSAVNEKGFLFLDKNKQNISLTINENGFNSVTKSFSELAAMEDEPENLFSFSNFSVFVESQSGYEAVNSGLAYYNSCLYAANQSPFIFITYDATTGSIMNLGQVKKLDGQYIGYDWLVPLSVECGVEPT